MNHLFKHIHRLSNAASSMCNANILKSAGPVTLIFALMGCATIPADRNLLPQQDMARAQLAANIKLAHDGWPDRQWWTQYGDLQLNTLIAQALTSSPTLDVAASRIGSARAALAVNSADQGLNANVNAAGNRQRYSSNGLLPAPIGGSYFNEATVQAQARYDFDWWGKHRAQITSALGEVNARRADYAQAEQVLAAAIAQSYFNMQGGWARLANLHVSVEKQSDIVADKVKRIAHGVAAIDEQRTAEAELSNLNKQVAQLDAQIAGEREALRALLGADSDALVDLKLQQIPDIPQTLPSRLGMELLARRPDLQAARWRVEASLSRIEAVQATFYPDINLTGAIGLDSLSLSTLLTAASRTLFIGPTLSLPLFDSARLDARLDASRTARNELIADYNQSVFNAVRDVAQQVVALQGIEIQVKEQTNALHASDALLRSAQAKFKQGLVDRGTLLSAELAQSKQRDASLQLENQQVLVEVSLVRALGGGYMKPVDLVLNNTPAGLSQQSK